MKKRQIVPVGDMKEKYMTYKATKARLNVAIKEGFYLEAIFIEYALLEDRIRSFLYHMGLLESRTSTRVFTPSYNEIEPIILHYKKKDEDTYIRIDAISDKIKTIRCVAKWATETVENYEEDSYLKTLKSQFEDMDIGWLLGTLEALEVWKDYRNELTHGLFNKNLEAVDEKIAERVLSGFDYAKTLDNQLRMLKKDGRVRKAIGLE